VALDLQAVLEHPVLAHSSPEVLAGVPAGRLVRWVHSSDIYDIAPLLRGGELLLTTGLGLETSDPEQRRDYVRALAERDVAGVALELSQSFGEVPAEMVEEARLLDLPLVALRRVYPFVEVTEQINSAILESSISRLRHSDEVGRALARVLAERGGIEALATSLAALLGRPVVVTDALGSAVAVAAEDAETLLARPSASVAVTADDLLLGGLVVGEGDTDPALLEAALDRAPEFLAIELLRGGPQSLLSGREGRAVLRDLLAGGRGATAALASFASRARVRREARWCGVAIDTAAGQPGLVVAQDLGRAVGARVIAAELEDRTFALLATAPATTFEDLSARLRSVAGSARVLVAVGPVVDLDGAGRSLRAAGQAVRLDEAPRPAGTLLVAEELVVQRLLAGLPDRRQLEDLVEEQLGDLLRSPNGETLVHTLEQYLACGCSKAATARALHLRRQSVHQRLARAATRLGHDVTAPDRHTALRLALAARAALGQATTVPD
jgi:purine catabolism regulator